MNLVTGATGIIGSHLLVELVKRGEKVRATKRENSKLNTVRRLFEYHKLSPDQFESIDWIQCDILNPQDVFRACEGVNAVYHCAAMVSFFSNDADKIKNVNIHGTRHIVNACLEQNISALCHVSSTGAIGRQIHNGVVSEKDQWLSDVGNSEYSRSKYLSELEAWRGAEEGLNVVVVNPCIVIGPGNWGQSSTSLIVNAARGMRFYSAGSNAFVDARDVAKSMADLVDRKIFGKRFLVVGENRTYKDVLRNISGKAGVRKPDRALPRWMAEFAWRTEMVLSFFSGRKPRITRETVDSAYHNVQYSNQLIKHDLGIRFTSIDESIGYTLELYNA